MSFACVSEYKQIITQTGLPANASYSLGLIRVLTTIQPYCLEQLGSKGKREQRRFDQYRLIICCLLSQRDESHRSAMLMRKAHHNSIRGWPRCQKRFDQSTLAWLISTHSGSRGLFLHLRSGVCCFVNGSFTL